MVVAKDDELVGILEGAACVGTEACGKVIPVDGVLAGFILRNGG